MFCIENLVELLDLPDEMILAIMNKIKPRAILLYSMIGIKNIRLEQLALGQCHSIDLTSDYFSTPYQTDTDEFFSITLPCIFNYIVSLTIDIAYITRLDHITEAVYGENCLNNLKHLKIMDGHLCRRPRRSFRSGKLYLLSFYSKYKHVLRQELTLFMISVF